MSEKKQTSKPSKRVTKAELLEQLEDIQLQLEDKNKSIAEHQKQAKLQERNIKRLEKEIRKARDFTPKIVDEPESPKDQVLQEEITTSKASFLIDFYDEGEAGIRGKIEHLLTKKKKAFKGLDAESIISFLQERVSNGTPTKQDVEAIAEPLAEDIPLESEVLQLKEFSVLAAGQRTPTQILKHDIPYKVQLEWADTLELSSSNFTIYAKPLGGGNQQAVGYKDVNSEQKTDTLSVDIFPSSLLPGTYRLIVNMNYNKPGRDEIQDMILSKSSLIQVY